MTTEPKLLGCTHAKVRQLARRLSQHYDAEVMASGLKTTQFSMLSHVVGFGPIRSVDLAARMRMTASTLSRNVQPLITAGWVEPIPGPDGRSRLLRATEAGVAKRKEALHFWKLAQRKLAAQLGVGRVTALHALIDDSLALLAPAVEQD